jgi:hypothetical protein
MKVIPIQRNTWIVFDCGRMRLTMVNLKAHLNYQDIPSVQIANDIIKNN